MAPAIRAVGCSAIGPCMLPVDPEGKPLRPAVLYGIDTRAAAEIAELTEALGSEAIYRTSGTALSTQSVGPKILWERRHEPGSTHAARFVTSTTFS